MVTAISGLSIDRGGDFTIGPTFGFGEGMLAFGVGGHSDFGSAVVGAVEAGGASSEVEIRAIGLMAVANQCGELWSKSQIKDCGNDQRLTKVCICWTASFDSR